MRNCAVRARNGLRRCVGGVRLRSWWPLGAYLAWSLLGPLVITGTPEEQSANRRVEIRMRKTPPTREQMQIAPKKANIVEEAPVTPMPPAVEQTPPPPKALLVKPKRALPVEETPPPRAVPAVPRAEPVDGIPPLPEVPRASPVETPNPPEVQKALPVGEG